MRSRLRILLAALLLCGCAKHPTAAFQQEVWPEEKLIAITFDDGPHGATTERLLTGLRERDAAGTFFLVGTELAGQEALVRRMQQEGHQIGNHTWSHARLPEEDLAGLLREVTRNQIALEEILGPGEKYWLRPPYGLLKRPEEVEVPIIQWSIDPRDWEKRDREAVVRHILRYARPGAIILLHDRYEASVDAALTVIDRLQEEGYRFVTVRELLHCYGVAPEAGSCYRSGDGAAAE